MKVLAPQSLKGHIKHTAASFGNPPYGGTLTGQLFYWNSQHLGCAPLDRSLIPDDAVMQGRTIIVMLDRGNCTFVQKVRDAENIAANAVVVVNSDNSLITMADDGTGRNVGIPSVLITKREGDRLKAAVSAGTRIMVEMRWSMPHPDNHVEWDLWTSSGDSIAAAFLQEFEQPALALSDGDHASFTPNYGIIDGTWYQCHEAMKPCGAQCTNGGRYCAEDPDHDLTHGADGASVVRENLRQLCVWEHANSTRGYPSGGPKIWWDYVAAFGRSCVGSGKLTQACSDAAAATVSPTLAAAVSACVARSGGSGDADGANTLLEAQLSKARKDGVAITPAVRINGRNYHGGLQCPAPISLGSCPVLGAICAGFQQMTTTTTTALPPACRPDHCWAAGGVDACGVCGGDGNSCAGCDGVANSKQVRDACGVCGGDGSTDLCGNCFPAGDLRRDKACADTISATIEVVAKAGEAAADTGALVALLTAEERAVEAGVAAVLAPNVTGAEDIKVLSVSPHRYNSNSSGDSGSAAQATATVKLEIVAHPGTGEATSRAFEAAVGDGHLDAALRASAGDAGGSNALADAGVRAYTRDHLPDPVVRRGTPAGGRVEFVPAGGGGRTGTGSGSGSGSGGQEGIATAQIAGIAVAGVCALALFGVGVRQWVVKREARVRMDMRNLISEMGRPMEQIENPAQGDGSANAGVDFSSL